MNDASLKGNVQDFGGTAKQAVGDATGDRDLQGQGMADQMTGGVNKAIGAAQDAIAAGPGPLIDQAKAFAREKPWATAALVGTLGLALFNTLRGKK